MSIQIYVGTYAKYNNGSISGEWIDVTDLTEEEFLDQCKELHSDEEDPEFMFQDTDIDLEVLRKYVKESYISSEFWNLKEMLSGLDENEQEAFEAYLSNGMEADLDDFRDAYMGHVDAYDVETAFAEQLMEETGELQSIPEHLRYYFDFEAYGRDLFISDFFQVDGYVFRNC